MADQDVGKRLKAFRVALYGEDSQGTLAAALSEMLAGKPIAYTMVSAWERGVHSSRYSVAAVAMLHPTDPKGCLAWLVGKAAKMPRIHEYRPQDERDGSLPTEPQPFPAEPRGKPHRTKQGRRSA